MHPFTLERPRDLAAALAMRAQAGRNDAPAEYIAGGTDMVQLLQENVRRPERLVSLAGLLDDRIEVGRCLLRLDALRGEIRDEIRRTLDAHDRDLQHAIELGLGALLRHRAHADHQQRIQQRAEQQQVELSAARQHIQLTSPSSQHQKLTAAATLSVNSLGSRNNSIFSCFGKLS